MKKYIAIIVALMGLGMAGLAETIPLDTILTFNISLTEVDGSYQPSGDSPVVYAQVYSNVEVPIAGHPDISHARVRVRISADQIAVTKDEICQAIHGQPYTQALYESTSFADLKNTIIALARAKFLAAMTQQ